MIPNPWFTSLCRSDSSVYYSGAFLGDCSPSVINITSVLIQSIKYGFVWDSQSVPLLFLLSTQLIDLLFMLTLKLTIFGRIIVTGNHCRLAPPPPRLRIPRPLLFLWSLSHVRPKLPPHLWRCPHLSAPLSTKAILRPEFVREKKWLKKVKTASRVGKFGPRADAMEALPIPISRTVMQFSKPQIFVCLRMCS